MPDDYARKNYQDKQFKDWLGTKTSKQMWNRVLEAYPGQGEFSRIQNSTPLSRSIQRFIKQSEFKKPYLDNDFPNMEGEWEGPGNGLPVSGFDMPWSLVNPLPIAPSHVVFDAESDSVYCAGTSTPLTITGTYPISFLTITFGAVGTVLSDIAGYGSNTVTATIEAAESQTGFITIEASMEAAEGTIPGDSNVNIFEDCCSPENEMEADPVNTPETIAQSQSITVYVEKGSGPYTWSRVTDVCAYQSAASFVLADSETDSGWVGLTASASARGSCEIKCVDACGTEITQQIRCSSAGTWNHDYLNYQCLVPGDATAFELIAVIGFGNIYAETNTKGCVKNGFRKHAEVSESGANEDCNDCTATPYSNPDVCVTWDCFNISNGMVTCDYARCTNEAGDFCTENQIAVMLWDWR